MMRTSHAPARAPVPFLRSPAGIAGVLLLLAFALLYGATLDNGLRPEELAGGDLITHQYAQAQARFSNAPGYPLYTMGGWLWFRIGRLLAPDANPIPLLSSYSTVWALLALWLLYRLILEARAAAWPIALLAAAFYGVTYFFWYYAVTTEQYTSSVAWTLAAVLLAFRWERTGRDRHLLGLALLAGIGLAHQVTILAVLPPIAWFVLGRQPGVLRRGRLLAAAAVLLLAPLLSYAYVYLRGAQHPEWRGAGEWASTWHWFWSFVSTAQGRGELTWSLRPFLTAEFPALIWREMTWPGLIAGCAGWLALPRRRGLLLYATLAIYLVFCWIDRLGNWFQVIMPVYALLVVGLAASAAWALNFRGRAGGAPGLLRRAGAGLALIALIAYRGALSYPQADASNRPADTGLAPAWAILADDPPPGGAIFATQAEALALNYVTQVWGQRQDLAVLTAAQARARFAGGAGFAVTAAALPLAPVEVTPEGRYSALGRTLVAVEPAPALVAPAGAAAWQHDFAGVVQLIGGWRQENRATGEQVALLVWRAPQPPAEDWSVSVRLMQGEAEVAQIDQRHPVYGAYPLTRWSAGEVVVDAYPFPAGLAADGMAVILYRPAADGFVNLDVARFHWP